MADSGVPPSMFHADFTIVVGMTVTTGRWEDAATVGSPETAARVAKTAPEDERLSGAVAPTEIQLKAHLGG